MGPHAAIALLAISLTAAGATPVRHYHIATPTLIADTVVAFGGNGAAAPLAAVEARIAADEPARLRQGASPVHFTIGCGSTAVNVRRHTGTADNIDDGRYMAITILDRGRKAAEAITRSLDTGGGPNSYLMEWDGDTGLMTLYAGATTLDSIISLPLPPPPPDATLTIAATGAVTASLLVSEQRAVGREERLAGLSGVNIDSVTASLCTAPFPEGIYYYLDRTADPAVARPGGRYELAVVADPGADGCLSIIYLAGAEVERRFWRRGMLKGRLCPTPFRDQYDLVWYDAHGEPVAGCDDAYAVTDRAAHTLSVTFPSLDGATMRFALRAAE